MIVTHKLTMDLIRRSEPRVEVVQDDRYSRNLQIRLTANGAPFALPADCAVEVRFRKSDGKSGRYDTMPDGSQAWEVEGDTLTVRLAPQTVTVAGAVWLSVSVVHQEQELSCFPIQLQVLPRPELTVCSRDYVNVTRFLPQPEQAEPGMFLRVSQVDDRGRITEVDCVGGAAAGEGPVGQDGGYYTLDVTGSDGTMVVSYSPSRPDMPPVASQTLPLPKGKDGISGVHLGATAPTDPGVNVWIDPEGGEAGGYSLPLASADTLGGVMPVAKNAAMTLAVGVDSAGRLFTDGYPKATIDAALGAYISDINTLIGGEG